MSSSPKPAWMRERDAKAKRKKETARYNEQSEWKQQRNTMIQRKEQVVKEADNAPEFMKKLGALKSKPVVVKRPEDDEPTIDDLDDGTDIPPWHRDDAAEYPDWLKEAWAARELQEAENDMMDESDMGASFLRLDVEEEDDNRPEWMKRAVMLQSTSRILNKSPTPSAQQEEMPAWMVQRQKMKERSSRESSPTTAIESRIRDTEQQPESTEKPRLAPIVSAEELRKSAVKERVDLQPHLGNKPTPRVSADELRSSVVKEKIEQRPSLHTIERRISFQNKDLESVKGKLKPCDTPAPDKPQWMVHAADIRKKAAVRRESMPEEVKEEAAEEEKPEWMQKFRKMKLQPEETTTITTGVTRRSSAQENDAVIATSNCGYTSIESTPKKASPTTTTHQESAVPAPVTTTKAVDMSVASPPPSQKAKVVKRTETSEYIEIPVEDFIEIPVEESSHGTDFLAESISRINSEYDPALATAAEAAITAAAKDDPEQANRVAEVVEEQIEVVQRFSVLMRELMSETPNNVRRNSSKYGLTIDSVMQYLHTSGLDVVMSPPASEKPQKKPPAAAMPDVPSSSSRYSKPGTEDTTTNSEYFEEVVVEDYEEVSVDEKEDDFKRRSSAGEYEEIVIEDTEEVAALPEMSPTGNNGIHSKSSDMDMSLQIHPTSKRGDVSDHNRSSKAESHERRSKQLGQSLSSFLDEKKQVDKKKRSNKK